MRTIGIPGVTAKYERSPRKILKTVRWHCVRDGHARRNWKKENSRLFGNHIIAVIECPMDKLKSEMCRRNSVE